MWMNSHMGPAEKGNLMHRVHCVKEHGGREWVGTALLLTLTESRLGPGWFGASRAHRSSGSHWPSLSPWSCSQRLWEEGALDPPASTSLLGFSSLQGWDMSLASFFTGF